MIAGIGNVFLSDDGFGPAVAQALQARPARAGVLIKDFGTGAVKLAYDLMTGYDALIIVDAARRGGAPGTLYLIEPDAVDSISTLDPHGADLRAVLAQIDAFKVRPKLVRIIGCEPLDAESLEMALTPPVAAAVNQAVEWIDELLEGGWLTPSSPSAESETER